MRQLNAAKTIHFLQALHADCISQAQTYYEEYFDKNKFYGIFVYHHGIFILSVIINECFIFIPY